MRIAEEVSNRLRNGEDPGTIRESYRSQSQVSEGFRLYLGEQENKIRKTRTELTATKEELEQTTDASHKKQLEKNELAKEVEGLKSEKDSLRNDVDDKRAEYELLRSRAEALQKRGFTQEIMTRLEEVSKLSGPEVWRTLQSLEERSRLDEEIAAKLKTKIQVEREISLLEAKGYKVKTNVASTEKKLAATEAKVASYGEIADLVDSGLKSGYKLDDFQALLSFLVEKCIGLSPGQSIAHLLHGLEAVKSLEDTRAETILAEDRLTETLESEKQAKARIELAEKASIKAIEEQKAAGTKSISEYASIINEWIGNVVKNFQKEIERAKTNSANNAKLEQEKIQLEKLILPARVLLGIVESEDSLRAVEPVLVIQLLERLQWWLDLRWLDAKVNVIQDFATMEFRLAPPAMYGMKMVSLIKVAIKAIRQLSLEEKAGAHSGKG